MYLTRMHIHTGSSSEGGVCHRCHGREDSGRKRKAIGVDRKVLKTPLMNYMIPNVCIYMYVYILISYMNTLMCTYLTYTYEYINVYLLMNTLMCTLNNCVGCSSFQLNSRKAKAGDKSASEKLSELRPKMTTEKLKVTELEG